MDVPIVAGVAIQLTANWEPNFFKALQGGLDGGILTVRVEDVVGRTEGICQGCR